MNAKKPALTLADIQAARKRIASGIRLTPCALAPSLSEIAGIEIWLKRDDLQRTGSFKERGARHALLRLDPRQRARGVVAASAGNHALGLAYHGPDLGARVTVVMPAGAPAVKVARCRSLNAEVVLFGADYDEAQAEARRISRQSGFPLIHPFDDLDVIAGQGTMALEILEQAGPIDTLVLPVGGAGLLAGAATVAKAARPGLRVVAVHVKRAPAFREAFKAGQPVRTRVYPTLADGLAVQEVGRRTFELAAPLVDDVVTVDEREVACAISLLARRAGTVAEGAGAVALAAVLSGKTGARSAAVPVSGRNIDPHTHQRVLATAGIFSKPPVQQIVYCEA